MLQRGLKGELQGGVYVVYEAKEKMQKTHHHVFPWTSRSLDCLLSFSPLRIFFCLFSIYCLEFLAVLSGDRKKYVYSIFPGSRSHDKSLFFLFFFLNPHSTDTRTSSEKLCDVLKVTQLSNDATQAT